MFAHVLLPPGRQHWERVCLHLVSPPLTLRGVDTLNLLTSESLALLRWTELRTMFVQSLGPVSPPIN